MTDEVNMLDLAARGLFDHVDRTWEYVINGPNGEPFLAVLPLAQLSQIEGETGRQRSVGDEGGDRP